MDPVTAMGLVSSLITFIDFSWKLVNGANDIYESANGTSADNAHITNVVQDLQCLTSELDSKVLGDSIRARALKRLISKCVGLSDELLEILIKLRVTEKNSRWDALKVKWASMCKKQDIAAIRDRIADYRSEIILHLNTITLGHQSLVKIQLDSLREEFKRFSTSRVQEIKMLRSNLRSISESLSRQESSSTSEQEAPLCEARDLLTSFRSLARRVPRENKILRHIYFDTMYDREDAIHDARGDTYEWLLEQDTPSHRDSFGLGQGPERRAASEQLTTWLRDEGGVFHMSGRPGSGKSTVMKLIYGHPTTKELLGRWAAGRRLITAHFYFWSSGDPIQRSLEGLYRSILFEVLKAYPNLISEVFPEQWESLEREEEYGEDGPVFSSDMFRPAKITEAFRALVAYEKHQRYKFCFFIDGLDARVNHWELAESIYQWTGQENIKCCVSSRPYTEFLRTFPEETRLYLHDLNKLDISKFCRQMLETDRNFKRVASSYTNLITRIVALSEGVFLWARLVVRVMVSSISRYDSESILHKKLEMLPKDLEALYDRLIGDLDPVDRRLSDLMFFVALKNNEMGPPDRPLGALAFSYVSELEDESFPSPHQVKTYSKVDLSERLEQVKRQISSLTKGILEVGLSRDGRFLDESSPVSNAMHQRVRFFHRTAADYMMSGQRLKGIELNWVSTYTRLRIAEMASYNRASITIGSAIEMQLFEESTQLLENPSTGNLLQRPSTTSLRLLEAFKDAVGLTFPPISLAWRQFSHLSTQVGWLNDKASFDHYMAYLGYKHYILSRLRNRDRIMQDDQIDILLSSTCGPNPDVGLAVSLLRAGYSPTREIELFHEDARSEKESTTAQATIWMLMIGQVIEYMVFAADLGFHIDWRVITQRVRILMEFVALGIEQEIIISFRSTFGTQNSKKRYLYTTLKDFILVYLSKHQHGEPIPAKFYREYKSEAFLTLVERGASYPSSAPLVPAKSRRLKGADILTALQGAEKVTLAAAAGERLHLVQGNSFRLC